MQDEKNNINVSADGDCDLLYEPCIFDLTQMPIMINTILLKIANSSRIGFKSTYLSPN